MNKKQKLSEILFEVNNLGNGCKEWRLILDGVETLNNFKSHIEWMRNHVDCCEKQLNKAIQYHHGNKYYYHESDLLRLKRACITLAYYVGYELYSPNGSWFIRSIK